MCGECNVIDIVDYILGIGNDKINPRSNLHSNTTILALALSGRVCCCRDGAGAVSLV